MSAVRHYTLEELQQKQEKAAQRQAWLAESAKRAAAKERALKKKIARQDAAKKAIARIKPAAPAEPITTLTGKEEKPNE